MSEIIISNRDGRLVKTDIVENGRQKYEVIDNKAKTITPVSVAQKDTFEYEKNFKTLINVVGNVNPDEIKQREQSFNKESVNRKMRFVSISSAVLGGALPAIGISLTKMSKALKWGLSIPIAFFGAIGGFIGGTYVATKHYTYQLLPELKSISEASAKLKKLDIVEGQSESLKENAT